MMKGVIIGFFIVLLVWGCKNQDSASQEDEKISLKKDLIIVYNRYHPDNKFSDESTEQKESFIYWREGFDDPNLHIGVFHGLDQEKSKINRKNLDKMKVWFDSEMEYIDWFHLSTLESYYIIFEDEYLVKGSLDPNYEFDLYEVSVATGGTE